MNFKSVLPKFGGAKPSDNKNKTEKRLYAAVLSRLLQSSSLRGTAEQ